MPKREAPRQPLTILQKVKNGGEGGIRTHGAKMTAALQAVPLSRSGTSPFFQANQ